MPFDDSQKDEIKNHVPTILQNCKVFLHVFDVDIDGGDDHKALFLEELVEAMEADLQIVKDIVQTQIP